MRILVADHSKKADGIAIPCEIASLIKSVVFSPKSPEWFLPLVEDVVVKFDFQLPIAKSSLAQQPFFYRRNLISVKSAVAVENDIYGQVSDL